MLENLKQSLVRLAFQEGTRRRARGRRGMTLMEVMIVITIILLLTGALAFGLMGFMGDAQRDMALMVEQKIDQKAKIYRVRHGKLPDSVEELYKGEEPPVDPWHNKFRFVKGGGKDGYDIISYGADGKEGGTGADADVKLSEAGK
jgi:general secretion pathway protein G